MIIELDQREKLAAFLRSTQHDDRKQAEKLVLDYLQDMNGKLEYEKTPQWYLSGKVILESSPEFQSHILLQIFTVCSPRLATLRDRLVQQPLVFNDDQMIELLWCWSARPDIGVIGSNELAPHLKRYRASVLVLPELFESYLWHLRSQIAEGYYAKYPEQKRLLKVIEEVLGEVENGRLPDATGETWATQSIAEVSNLLPEQQRDWKRFFYFLASADGSKPTKDWTNKAQRFIESIGSNAAPMLARWLSLVTAPVSLHTPHHTDRNVSILKGLAWCCIGRTEPEIARALEKMTVGCLVKVPGSGPWAARAASAAVYTLSESPDNPEAIPALARLKSKVTYRTTLTLIESALETAADRQGVTKDDLEDLSVPTYGFGVNGTRRELFGDAGEEYAVEAQIGTTSEVTLSFFAPGGRPLKTAPTMVKQGENAERFQVLKSDVNAAGKTLTAQKARFDGFYLAQRSWKYTDFVTRFVEHPLLSHIANRLVWHFVRSDGAKGEGVYDATTGSFADVHGNVLLDLTPDTTVALWHPLGFAPEYVVAWRERLSTRGIVQPFKQAHREVYLLTDAELATGTYSNRFAGHILKQHQMNALAHGRGWKNPLRLMIDGTYPPATRELPLWNLRAEYWVEGVGDEYGTDTNDSGAYLYLSTDQVRFYSLGATPNYSHASGGGYACYQRHGDPPPADPLLLSDVPAVLFSEVLRDIDLFVGVASVGNDPSWVDSGEAGNAGRYNAYWQEYSFGDLSASAETRKVVLQKLLPRLKIAGRCELVGRFLRVRGDLRSYKIHLGSGNILMEPNDQYLCIVPGRSDEPTANALFLPFEGDSRLSVILSKAFLLAADTSISDRAITSQLR